jgi:hypothetical protein
MVAGRKIFYIAIFLSLVGGCAKILGFEEPEVDRRDGGLTGAAAMAGGGAGGGGGIGGVGATGGAGIDASAGGAAGAAGASGSVSSGGAGAGGAGAAGGVDGGADANGGAGSGGGGNGGTGGIDAGPGGGGNGGTAGVSGGAGGGGNGGTGGIDASAGGGGNGGTAGVSGGAGGGGTGGTAGGSGGAGGAQPDATVVDTGVIIDGSPKDIVASDVTMGACCTQIDLSLCRFTMSAAFRTCWACTPGCYAPVMPTTPVDPITKCDCSGRTGNQRCIKIENRCNRQVRAKGPNNSTVDLNSGDCSTSYTTAGFRAEGSTNCETGTCDPSGPHTLVEMNLATTVGGTDWYDLSHVDGANLPIGIYLVKGTFTPPTSPSSCECLDRECRVDIKATTCLPRNQLTNASSKVYACAAECRLDPAGDPNHDLACCTGTASTPDKCPPTSSAVQRDYQMFRFPCPQAYSYTYDEMHEVDQDYVLCTCKNTLHTDYDIIFCP